MADSLGTRLKNAWNIFMNRDPTNKYDYGSSYYYRPDRFRITPGREQTMINSVCNRIAIDCASVNIKHVKVDQNNRFIETVDSGLNNCLTLQANIDQTARAFILDVVLSMLDQGTVALVPVDTVIKNGSIDIKTMRTGKIVAWYSQAVKVSVFNQETLRKEQIVIPKQNVAIVENPLYAVMNQHNSTMQRLINKLALLDQVDAQSGSGKLDLIIQLPYVIKTEARRKQAEQRRKDIQDQLSGSKYGIAYTDGTQHITQLNRSVENNLLKQIQYLTNLLYSQLGLTDAILNGTADEKAMLNYFNRTVQPILSAITDELKRKFLTKTARTQHQSIMFFRDPFKLVPVDNLSEIADKFTRNEIMTSNEIRQVIGMKPSEDPSADVLRNKNLSPSAMEVEEEETDEMDKLQNEEENLNV